MGRRAGLGFVHTAILNRIALVLCGDLSETTGGFVYDRCLVNELQSAGLTVEVISLPWHRYGLQLAQNFDRHWHNRLRALEADIVLQDELCHPALVGLNRWVAGPGSSPRVAIVHHLRSREDHPSLLAALYTWIERAYLQTLDGFIFNSHDTEHSVRALIGDAAPGVVAHPGRSEIVLEAAPEPGAELQLLFVGGLTPRKGLHTLLHALQDLREVDWRLHVVGRTDLEPGYARDMKQLTRRGGLNDRVRFYGSLPRAALDELYRKADLLVVPSKLEGFGMVYLEAMGFGLPVVASSRGGAPELVEHGRTGYLVPPESPEILAETLRPLMERPDRLIPLAKAARARYRDHHTWRETTEKVLGFLRDLVARRSTGLQDPFEETQMSATNNPRRTP